MLIVDSHRSQPFVAKFNYLYYGTFYPKKWQQWKLRAREKVSKTL